MSRVWARIAGISLATKYSPLPRPITDGGPVRAATILLGSGGGKNGQGIDSCQLLHRFAHGVLERAAVLHVLFHEVSDDFGVGFGDELVAFFFQLALQLDVILHDAVVDDDDLPGAVAMRVRVFFGRTAVRGPARVADAVRSVDRGLPDDFFEIVQLSRGAADLHLAVAADHGDAGRIVAAIFQAAEAVENQGNDFFRPDIADNSAHGVTLRVFELGVRHGSPHLKD